MPKIINEVKEFECETCKSKQKLQFGPEKISCANCKTLAPKNTKVVPGGGWYYEFSIRPIDTNHADTNPNDSDPHPDAQLNKHNYELKQKG